MATSRQGLKRNLPASRFGKEFTAQQIPVRDSCVNYLVPIKGAGFFFG
jgi:hypothetical protein